MLESLYLMRYRYQKNYLLVHSPVYPGLIMGLHQQGSVFPPAPPSIQIPMHNQFHMLNIKDNRLRALEMLSCPVEDMTRTAWLAHIS